MLDSRSGFIANGISHHPRPGSQFWFAAARRTPKKKGVGDKVECGFTLEKHHVTGDNDKGVLSL